MVRIYVIEPNHRTPQRFAQQTEFDFVGTTDHLLPDWNRNLECDLVLVHTALAQDAFAKLYRSPKNGLPKIIVTDTEEDTKTLLPIFEQGAAGYIPKGTSTTKMITMLKSIHDGKTGLPPEITSALVARMRELAAERVFNTPPTTLHPGGVVALTARERQILELVGNGLSNREIAAQLTIELGTVKNHIHNILKKLGLTSRVQAAEYYALAWANEND